MLEIVDRPDGGRLIRVSGEWTFASLALEGEAIDSTLARLSAAEPSSDEWDLAGLRAMDDAGAVRLAQAMRGAKPVGEVSRFATQLAQAASAMALPSRSNHVDSLALVRLLGREALGLLAHLRDVLVLLGTLTIDAWQLLRRPKEIPFFEISANIHRTGVAALPVTMLVGFLVGVVLTYLSALQLKKFGADLLVINIVSVGVIRELGPMLASIISAGRSGSTMTAQLGVMRVTEEIEALSVMGVSVTSRLVLPKVIGLAIALPLVTLATNLAALAGGMLISKLTLGIEYAAFLQALPRVVDVANLWIGLGKAIVFGVAVAVVACHYGLRILPNTESLGSGVTRSVVSAITAVILLDAIFAILLRNIG